MYICLCQDVTEDEIKAAICKGACSESCLQKRLGVSLQCGQCKPDVQEILQETLNNNSILEGNTIEDSAPSFS